MFTRFMGLLGSRLWRSKIAREFYKYRGYRVAPWQILRAKQRVKKNVTAKHRELEQYHGLTDPVYWTLRKLRTPEEAGRQIAGWFAIGAVGSIIETVFKTSNGSDPRIENKDPSKEAYT